MKVCIIYGTNASGTLEAAEIIGQEFSARGAAVTLASAGSVQTSALAAYDLVCFGSCTWGRTTDDGTWLDGQLQHEFFHLAQRLRKGKHLTGKQFAVFSLGDHRYTKFCAAADHLVDLVRLLDGRLIGQPLKVDQFSFRLSQTRPQVRAWAATLARTLAVSAVD